jgi:hypothetical protein
VVIPTHTSVTGVTLTPTAVIPTPTALVTITVTPLMSGLPETGDVTITPTIAPSATQSLKVQILGPDGLPLKNANVTLANKHYITDDNGYVQIHDLANGTYDVTVDADGKEFRESLVLNAYDTKKSYTLKLSDSVPMNVYIVTVAVACAVVAGTYVVMRRKRMFKRG